MAKKETKKKTIKPIEKKTNDVKLDFLELENRIQNIESALAEGLNNINTCMEHVLEVVPKVKKCAERLGIES